MPPGIVAPERMGRAIFGGHQRQVHEIAARQNRAHGEAGKVALGQVSLGLGDLERLVQGWLASSTTRAVINLVIDAMGAATSEFREYKIDESL